MWGLVFVGPLLLPDYPAALLSFGRYLAFGLIALPLAWLDRPTLRAAHPRRLAGGGQALAWWATSSTTCAWPRHPARRRAAADDDHRHAAGGHRHHQPTCATRGATAAALAALLPSLALIAAGIACVNQVELAHLRADPDADLGRYALGALLAVGAVACWTWYPIRNADWLRAHADRSPRTWATAQGMATLPLAALGYLPALGLVFGQRQCPLGDALRPAPRGLRGLMFAIGLFASVAGHAVLERGQPAPAHHAGGPADRLRDLVGAGLRAAAARRQHPATAHGTAQHEGGAAGAVVGALCAVDGHFAPELGGHQHDGAGPGATAQAVAQRCQPASSVRRLPARARPRRGLVGVRVPAAQFEHRHAGPVPMQHVAALRARATAAWRPCGLPMPEVGMPGCGTQAARAHQRLRARLRPRYSISSRATRSASGSGSADGAQVSTCSLPRSTSGTAVVSARPERCATAPVAASARPSQPVDSS
jgi:drug/metabolite transporter (DMT)-like permease